MESLRGQNASNSASCRLISSRLALPVRDTESITIFSIQPPVDRLYDEVLDAVLQHLKKHGVRVKAYQCEMFENSVEFLCHRVDEDGLRPTKEKVDALQNVPRSKNITEHFGAS